MIFRPLTIASIGFLASVYFAFGQVEKTHLLYPGNHSEIQWNYPSRPKFSEEPDHYFKMFGQAGQEATPEGYELAVSLSRSTDCQWVESTDPEAKPVTKVGALPILDCDKVVCTGVVRCTGSIQLGETQKQLDFSIDPVVCTSTDDKCPSAQECMVRGGALWYLAADATKENAGRIFSPIESRERDAQ